MEEEVSKFIKENLNVEIEVRKAYRIRRKEKEIVIASLDRWEQKREIMSKKKNLTSKPTQVSLSDCYEIWICYNT